VRVLVVDDEFLIVLMVASMLEDLGCEVETAFHGNEALGKLANDPQIELLITDVNMPGLSGYEVAERARGMRHGLKVILLSGAETDPRGLPLIRKPFRRSDLTQVMEATTGIC
jgi:two-component system cell cycle response regulator CpdR